MHVPVVLGTRLYVAPRSIPYAAAPDGLINGRDLSAAIAELLDAALMRLIPAWLDGGGDAKRRAEHMAKGAAREQAIDDTIAAGGKAADVYAATQAAEEQADASGVWQGAAGDLLALFRNDEAEALALLVLRWLEEVQIDAEGAAVMDGDQPVIVGRLDLERLDAGRADIVQTAAQLAHMWGAFPLPAGMTAGQRAKGAPSKATTPAAEA